MNKECPVIPDKNLCLRRYEMERLTYAVDQLIERLVPEVSLSEIIQYRKRFLALGVTRERVPYIEEPVWVRMKKMVGVLTGAGTLKRASVGN